MSRKLLKYLLIGIVATLIATFLLPKKEDATANTPRDYEAILQSGVLRATTEYNAISYYGFRLTLRVATSICQGTWLASGVNARDEL